MTGPAKEKWSPSAAKGGTCSALPEKLCRTPPEGRPSRSSSCEHGVVGPERVEQDREPLPAGDGEVPAEDRPLPVERGAGRDARAVESALADRHGAAPGQERFQVGQVAIVAGRGRVPGKRLRVDAQGRRGGPGWLAPRVTSAAQPAGSTAGTTTSVTPTARARARACVTVPVEGGGVEVAVGVDHPLHRVQEEQGRVLEVTDHLVGEGGRLGARPPPGGRW